MNPGYALTKPTTNPNAPDYAQWTLPSDQNRLDIEYLHGSGNSLDHFYAVAEAWKTKETDARAHSPSPDTYNPVFDWPVPKRPISDYFDGQWMNDPRVGFGLRYEQDPTIVAPKLDQWVKPTDLPKGISYTGAQPQMDAMLSMLSQILSILKSK